MRVKFPKLALLSYSPKLHRIVTNTGWLFVDRIVRMVLGLFVGVWVARYLGVDNFGLFSYSTALVALFSSLSQLGLPSLVVRTLTQEPEKREQILGTTFWLQLFGGFANLLFVIGSIFVLRSGDRLTLILVCILASAAIFRAFDTIDLWFQSQVRSKYSVLAKNTAFLITSLIKIALINAGAPLLVFAWATVAEAVIGAIGLIFFYKLQGYSLWKWRWSFQLSRQLLKESWPLILSGFTIMIYMKVDQIMLGELMNSQAVGLYSSAARISEAWYFIPTAIASSVAPSIYAAKKEERESSYYRQIEQLLKILSLTAFMIAVPMTFMSGTVMKLLFGSEYVAAGPILAIHIWAALFVFIGVGSSSWFIAEGLAHLSFRRTLIGAVLNIVLNFILIPMYGGIGAAIATVISQAFASFLSNATHPKARRIFQIQLKSFIPIPIPIKG